MNQIKSCSLRTQWTRGIFIKGRDLTGTKKENTHGLIFVEIGQCSKKQGRASMIYEREILKGVLLVVLITGCSQSTQQEIKPVMPTDIVKNKE